MSAPTLSSVSPSSGLAVGDAFVEVLGGGFNLRAAGLVRVTFGGVPASRVGVVSPTRLLVLAPPGDPDAGPVDVTATNLDGAGTPVGSATLSSAFAFRRPSIATPAGGAGYSPLVLTTRQLVLELQRSVLKNVAHESHPDWADDASAAVPQAELAKAPSIKVVGPRLEEDRANSRNDPTEVFRGLGSWFTYSKPVTVQATYDLIGVGRTSGEAANLWAEVARWLRHLDYLAVDVSQLSLAGDELAYFELAPVWSARGEFRPRATRQGLYVFVQQVVVRGISVAADELVGKSVEVEEVDLTVRALLRPWVLGPSPLGEETVLR